MPVLIYLVSDISAVAQIFGPTTLDALRSVEPQRVPTKRSILCENGRKKARPIITAHSHPASYDRALGGILTDLHTVSCCYPVGNIPPAGGAEPDMAGTNRGFSRVAAVAREISHRSVQLRCPISHVDGSELRAGMSTCFNAGG